MTTMEFESSINNAAQTLHPRALQLTRDAEDAKDLVQVTFMKAWANRNRFNPGTNLKAWLYTIMKNTFLTEYHRKRRQKTHVDLSENQYLINSSSTHAKGTEADAGLNLSEIRSAIEQLPDVYKIPFKSFLDGFKYEEISEKYHLPIGTVKNRIFLARQVLKEKLKYFNQDYSL